MASETPFSEIRVSCCSPAVISALRSIVSSLLTIISLPQSVPLFSTAQWRIFSCTYSTLVSSANFSISGTTVVSVTNVSEVIMQNPIIKTNKMAFTRFGFLILANKKLTLADIFGSKKSTNGLSRNAKMPAMANGNSTGVRRSSNQPTP